MNNLSEFDKWWSCLTVSEKERIATKANGTETKYPSCTTWWNGLENERKSWIREHCEKAHGSTIPVWQEGHMFSE